MSKKERESNRAARAAAVQQAQVRQERNRRLLITLAVVAVLAVIVTAGVLFSGGGSKEPAGNGALSVRAEGQALVLGDDPDATKVVIYEDFLCPYCRQFEVATRDMLHEAAASGKATVEYRPFQLLPDHYSVVSLTAWAAVLDKGTPEQALEFHNLLFDNQPYENAQDKPGVEELVALAEKAGVEDQDVLDAIGQENTGFVDQTATTAREAGVRGTPTVFVDGKELQAESVTLMVKALEDQLRT
jgi:protein-disulfide isomerase